MVPICFGSCKMCLSSSWISTSSPAVLVVLLNLFIIQDATLLASEKKQNQKKYHRMNHVSFIYVDETKEKISSEIEK